MRTTPRIGVDIVADTAGLQRELRKARHSLEGFGAEARRTVFGLAGLAGVGFTLERAFGGAFKEFSDGQRAMAQVRAAIKSTGGEAGVTANHVRGLAQSLSDLSGTNRNTIRSGEALLLTFRRIRNQAGEGNGIFDRAATIALDVATRKNEDYSVAVQQVGKALDNPIKATRTLRAMNIQLTKSQENQIKTMVATGNTLGAQKLILSQLQAAYQGAARAGGQTLSGQWNRLKNSAGELSASIVGMLVPDIKRYLTQARIWLQNTKNQKKILHDARAAVHALAGAIKTISGLFRVWGPRIKTAAGYAGGLKSVLGELIALKVASVVLGWAKAFRELAAAETLAAGAAGGAGGKGGLLWGLRLLAGSPVGMVVTGAAVAAGYGIYSGNYSPDHKRGAKFLEIYKRDKKAGKSTEEMELDWYQAGALSKSDAKKYRETHPVYSSGSGGRHAAAGNLGPDGKTTSATGADSPLDTALGLGPGDAGVHDKKARAHHKKSAKDLAKANQMAVLAVGPAGVNSVGELRSKLATIKDMVKGTVFDTKAVETEFASIRKVLSGALGKVGTEVRKHIQLMLKSLLDKVNQDADGFNLTIAEHQRRMADRRRARAYHAAHPGQHVFAPNVTVNQNQSLERELRRAHFHMRYAT